MAELPAPIDCTKLDKNQRESTVATRLEALLRADRRLAETPREVAGPLRRLCPGAEDQVANLIRVAETGLLPRLETAPKAPALLREIEAKTDLSSSAVAWAAGAWTAALAVAKAPSTTAPAKTSVPPPVRDESSPIVRGTGALVLSIGVIVGALIIALLLYVNSVPSDAQMQRCAMAGGSGAGGCGGNNLLTGLAIWVVIGGFGLAGWIWRKR